MKLIHIHGVWPLYTNTFLLITAAGHDLHCLCSHCGILPKKL